MCTSLDARSFLRSVPDGDQPVSLYGSHFHMAGGALVLTPSDEVELPRTIQGENGKMLLGYIEIPRVKYDALLMHEKQLVRKGGEQRISVLSC